MGTRLPHLQSPLGVGGSGAMDGGMFVISVWTSPGRGPVPLGKWDLNNNIFYHGLSTTVGGGLLSHTSVT